MKVLITGNAGFIGYHITKKLIQEGIPVIGYDNVNDYYDKSLKLKRLEILNEIALKNKSQYQFISADLSNIVDLKNCFNKFKPSIVINLAAQAGVRYSLENPKAYIDSNISGFANLLECVKEGGIKHFIFASSSSVYGGNELIPFSESHCVDHPVSLYAATKKSNEVMSHAYSHLFNIPITGLRFFTVYGPWGRPDMALFLFTKSIINGHPIKIFNNGYMKRDFTYIDDVTESIYRLINKPPSSSQKFDKKIPDPSESWAPYQIFNIGNSKPVNLIDFIIEIERKLGVEAIKEYHPMQNGDVRETYAETSKLESYINYKPKTSIKKGISEFIDWYNDFYKN